MISQLIYNIIVSSFFSSILVIVFIFSRKMIVKYIGATWNYYLWFTIFLPWMAIWLPWHFSSPTYLEINALIKPLKSSFINSSASFSLSLPIVLLTAWLCGIFICLLIILLKHFQFVLILKENSRLISIDEQEIMKQSLAETQKRYLSRIYLSTAIESPILCHIIKAKIYLPYSFFKNDTYI